MRINELKPFNNNTDTDRTETRKGSAEDKWTRVNRQPRRTFLRIAGAGIGVATLGSFGGVAKTQDSYPIVLEDGETGDLSRYSGEFEWTAEKGGDGYWGTTTDTDDPNGAVLSGNASMKGYQAAHGGYHTIVTMDQETRIGDTFQARVYHPHNHTYTGLLFGVQSEDYPYPCYRLKIDNGGGSGEVNVEKITAGDPIESHNLPDNRILLDADDLDLNDDQEWTVKWTWNNDGTIDVGLYQANGSVKFEGTSDADTEYSSGGFGFMVSKSNPNADDMTSIVDDYVILSSNGSEDTNSEPTASDDSASVTKGQSVTIDVLANDSDVDGSLDASSVTVVDGPSYGSTTVNTDGTIDYSHDGSDTQSDSFTYTVADDEGAISNEATVSVSVSLDESQSPYTDHDLSRIEGEDFDIGGEGVSYHDTSSGNNGGAYRDTDVDIQETSDDGGGYNIGWIEDGEWWEYTVDVPSDGEYELHVRLAGKNATILDVSANGSQLATVDVPNTGGWQDWTTVDAGTVTLSSGTNTIRLAAGGGSFNINWFGFQESNNTTNEAPTASNDSATVENGQNVTIDVLANDSDSDGSLDASSVTVVDGPPHGSTTVNTDGTIDYSHDGSDTQSDSFTYTVADDEGATSNEATVSISIETATETVRVTGDGAAGYNDSSTIRYIIETSGTIESAGTGDFETIDRAGGPVAAGRVPADGSDSDTFSLSDGDVTDVSTWGGGVTVTIDGTTWSG